MVVPERTPKDQESRLGALPMCRKQAFCGHVISGDDTVPDARADERLSAEQTDTPKALRQAVVNQLEVRRSEQSMCERSVGRTGVLG